MEGNNLQGYNIFFYYIDPLRKNDNMKFKNEVLLNGLWILGI